MQLNTILLMAEWQVKGLQLFVALSLLIILHEFGHFFFAKLFKTRVEKFYLFFDFLFPFGNVLPFSLFKKTKGETTYGIGWFPLGGYVKIAGMVDESMDKEQLAKPAEPWEYRSKKPWQRLFIMLGGIIVNVLVAIIIYSFVMGIWGESYLPTANAKYGIVADSTAQTIGFRNGDKIMAVDGRPVENFKEVTRDIIFNGAKTVSVLRDGQNMDIVIDNTVVGKILKSKKAGFLSPRFPFVIDEVSSKSVAEKMGFKKGDSIVAFNGEAVTFHDEFISKMKVSPVGSDIKITVVGEDKQLRDLVGKLPETKKIGIGPKGYDNYLEFKTIKYSFFPAIARGVTFTGEQFGFYMAQFKLLFTSKDVKLNENLGGIASFAKIFPSTFDWQEFWMLTAFISIILAFMNLLPIPGLDGGYVIFLLYEIITGRKVNDKVMEIATTVGLVLLLGLMLYANGLDIFRAFQK
ncbi:MAG: RIP metalloprotease RseP [Bacteroidota bacterium]